MEELAQLRNAAAHGQGDITLESALDYNISSKRVTEEISALTDELAAGRISVSATHAVADRGQIKREEWQRRPPNVRER